jgi:hypothetical protein
MSQEAPDTRLQHQRTAAWDPVDPLVERLVEHPMDALLGVPGHSGL